MKNYLLLLLALLPSPASAHIGDHTAIDLSAILGHLLEPDHLVMIIGAALASYFVVKRIRASRVSFSAKKDHHHESR